MIDPLDIATSLAKTKLSNMANDKATTAISNVLPKKLDVDKLKKIPLTKNPELLKQQAKAEAQKIIGEKQNELQQLKEKKTEELKDKAAKLASLAVGAVSLFIKLPILDPKLIATIAFLKAQKELREAKQKISKENLKKAKENFTYPIKPPKGIPKISKVPDIPQKLTGTAATDLIAQKVTDNVDPLREAILIKNAKEALKKAME